MLTPTNKDVSINDQQSLGTMKPKMVYFDDHKFDIADILNVEVALDVPQDSPVGTVEILADIQVESELKENKQKPSQVQSPLEQPQMVVFKPIAPQPAINAYEKVMVDFNAMRFEDHVPVRNESSISGQTGQSRKIIENADLLELEEINFMNKKAGQVEGANNEQ